MRFHVDQYIGDFRDDPAFNADAASVGGPNFIGRIRTVSSYRIYSGKFFIRHPISGAQKWNRPQIS